MAKNPQRTEAQRVINLIDLPMEQVGVLRIILRKGQASLTDLEQALANRLDRETILIALEALAQSGWLAKKGEGSASVYWLAELRRTGFSVSTLPMPRRGQSVRLGEILGAISQEEATPRTEVREATQRVGDWLKARLGHRFYIAILLLLSVFNAFALSSFEVASVSGFVGSLGTNSLPWLWVAETTLGLVVSGIYIQFTDRLPRLRLMKILVGGLAALYLIVAGLFALQLPSSILYSLVYLIKAQQIIIYPVAFWNLASSLYSLAEAKKIFPLLAAGEMIGGLVGYSLFSLPEMLGGKALFTSADAGMLLLISAGLFVFNLALIMMGIKENVSPETHPAAKPASLLENMREGLKLIGDIKFFRYLSLTVMFVWAAMNILWYHFYITIDRNASQAGNFETFYSLYQMATMLVPLLLQARFTGWLAKKVSTQSAFLGLPSALLLGSAAALIFPGLYAAIASLFLCVVTNVSWDGPTFQTLQNLIPEERRGRVSVLLGNYSYAVGTIVGSLFVGAVVLAGPRLGWKEGVITVIYLGANVLFGIGAVTAAIFARRSYEDSLLSWRLTRRSRGASVLDKIKFDE